MRDDDLTVQAIKLLDLGLHCVWLGPGQIGADRQQPQRAVADQMDHAQLVYRHAH